MRRYQYKQSKSPSIAQTHLKQSQSQQSNVTKLSEIRANGCFVRTELPTDSRICVFRYNAQTLPVETRFCGVIPTTMRQSFDPTQHAWYLSVRNCLHLTRVRVENSIAYMTSHCYRMRRTYVTTADGVSHQTMDFPVYEFGRHVYANRDGFLCMIEIWKAFRNNDRLLYSEQQYINDVLPKIRIEYFVVSIRDDEQAYGKVVEETPRSLVNTVSIAAKRSEGNNEWHNNRYWHKYGRQTKSRYCEWRSIKEWFDGGIVHLQTLIPSELWKICKTAPYFGIYVDSGAKLIVRDSDVTYDYNHTLIQSGVFIALQSLFRFTFMDNTQKLYSIENLRTTGLLPNNHIPEHPIVVLKAVPSMGGSNCWGLTIGDELVGSVKTRFGYGDRDFEMESELTVESILNVPLLGMNEKRLRVYEWTQGFEFVSKSQSQYNYSQFATTDRNRLTPTDSDINLSQFVHNEPLDYPKLTGYRR